MLIVEVALQGIRGFPATTRIALKPGINVAKNEDPKVRSALIDAIYHTLFPDPARGSATAGWSEGRESRIALTFYGRDKATYRLLREAENGATRLLKFDPAQKKYGLLSESSLETAQYVRVQQQLPDEVSYERLFLFAPESMPSRGAKAKTRSGAPIASGGAASPSGPGLAGRFASKAPAPRIASMAPRAAAPRGPSMVPRAASLPPSALGMNALAQSNASRDNEALELDMGSDDVPQSESEPEQKSAAKTEDRLAELDKLRKNWLAAQRAERAQAELDELNLMKVELSERAEQVVKLRQELVQLRKETPQDDRIANLPAGFDQKLRDFEALEAKFATENQRLFDEVTALENEEQHNYVTPLAKDRYFLAGIALALAMLGLAYAVARPFVALGNVLGVMVAAGAAFHWVAQLEGKAKLGFRVAAAKDRHQRLDRQRSLDTGATRRLMQELGIDTPSEVLERVNVFQAAQARVAEVEHKVTALIADPNLKRAEEELAGIKLRVEALEAEVLGASITISADTLEKRVSQMERELKAAGVNVPPRPTAKKPAAPAPIRTVTGDLLSTADLPPPGQAKARIAQPRSASTADFSPPAGEPLLRSPTLSGLPAWPPPGVDVSSDLPFGSGKHTPAPRGASLVGQPVRPPARSPSIPGGSERRGQSLPSAPPPARSTSVPGVLAPNRPLSGAPARGPSQPPKPSLPPAPSLAPAPKPAAGEKGMFDFGGGNIGGDDEEEGGEGYGAGYGGGSGGGSKEKESPAEDGLWAMSGGGPGGFGGASGYGDEGGAAALEPDRSRDLVQAAVDLLQQDVDSLTQSLDARLGQYLMALTDKRFQTATFGARGELSVVSVDGGEPVPYVELDVEIVDQVDTALRMALIEAVLRKVRVPILIDDPFTDYPPKRRKLMSQMIGYLGSATQMLIATSHEDLTGNELSW